MIRNLKSQAAFTTVICVMTLCADAGVVSADAAIAPTNSAAAPPLQAAQGKKRFIVTLEREASPDDFCARRGFKALRQTKHSPNGFAAHRAADEALILSRMNMVICDLTDDDARVARGEKGVRFVEADGIVAPCGQIIPSGLIRIGADHFPVAHISGTPKPLNVDVAVLDTGIDPHIDLNIYTSASVYNTTADDLVGHGTTVAGVIAAIDNQIGVVGVAPGVRLWNIQAIGQPPNNGWSNILQAMEYAYENADQISVVNMSFENVGPAPYNATRIAVKNLVSAGVVCVAAAGNNAADIAGPDGVFGTDDDFQPAAIPEVMAVSGMDPSNDTMWFARPGYGSNFSQIPRTNNPATGMTNYVVSPGGAIDVAAPCVNILTTAPFATAGTNNGYEYFTTTNTGTSLAAPHVTGLVALYIAANGRATNAEGVYHIRQAIINASLPQSQWHPHGQPFDPITNPTGDPDTNAEPLALASEAWIPQPAITNFSGAPGNTHVGFAAVPGYDYAVQSAANLAPAVAWSNLATISGSNSVAAASLTDTNRANESFYRLVRTPSP